MKKPTFIFLLFALLNSAWAFDRERIEDNSFLIEEAYNQDNHELQHVQMFSYVPTQRQWVYFLSQEFPVPYKPHQFSYDFRFLNLNGVKGIGDLFLHYRNQLVEYRADGRGILFAPRVTLILPTGKASNGLGVGVFGFEAGLPLTFEATPFWTFHSNLSATYQKEFSLKYGLSAIAMPYAWFNVFLEAIAEQPQSAMSLTLNPGVRFAVNFERAQMVPGLSFPIVTETSALAKHEFSGIFYLSFEHLAL